MKKILLAAITAALMLCLCAAACAEAAQTYQSGAYNYILLEDGTAEIIRYYGMDETLEIPSQLDGHAVTGIGGSAFHNRRSLSSVTIPSSVTSIGDSAFDGCESLTAVTVTRGSYAAQYCKDNNLPYIYPDSLDWLNN